MNRQLVVGLGEVLWDMLPEGKKMGGAPANFAYHASQFGWESCVVSAVGHDELGDELLENLQQKSLPFLIERTDYPTGTVGVEVDDKGVPQYNIHEDVAWDHIPFTSRLEEVARHTQAVCFGSLAQRHSMSRATILRFLDTMPEEEGRYRIFDINLRQNFYTPEILSGSLERCNILKINDEELDILSRIFGLPDTGVQKKCHGLLEEYGLKALILTCGTQGSFVFTPDDASFQNTPKVEVADTVGAGDSFTAAFAAALLDGKDLHEAHRLAVETSAYVCTQYGAMPVLPQQLTQRA